MRKVRVSMAEANIDPTHSHPESSFKMEAMRTPGVMLPSGEVLMLLP